MRWTPQTLKWDLTFPKIIKLQSCNILFLRLFYGYKFLFFRFSGNMCLERWSYTSRYYYACNTLSIRFFCMDINSCFSLFPRNLKIIMKLTASISKFLKLMVIKNAFLFQDRGSAKKQERRVNKLKGKLSRKANDATSIKGRSATVSMEAEQKPWSNRRGIRNISQYQRWEAYWSPWCIPILDNRYKYNSLCRSLPIPATA